jgi:hypothetical protein
MDNRPLKWEVGRLASVWFHAAHWSDSRGAIPEERSVQGFAVRTILVVSSEKCNCGFGYQLMSTERMALCGHHVIRFEVQDLALWQSSVPSRLLV